MHEVYGVVPGNFVGSISDFTDPSNQSEEAFHRRANKLSSVTILDIHLLSNYLGVLPVYTCLPSFSGDWDSIISTRCEKPRHCLQTPWHLRPYYACSMRMIRLLRDICCAIVCLSNDRNKDIFGDSIPLPDSTAWPEHPCSGLDAAGLRDDNNHLDQQRSSAWNFGKARCLL